MTGEGFARDGYKEQGAYPEVVSEHVACEFIKKSVRFLSPDTVSEYYPLQQPKTGIFTRWEKSTGLFFSQTGHKLASNYTLSPVSPLICPPSSFAFRYSVSVCKRLENQISPPVKLLIEKEKVHADRYELSKVSLGNVFGRCSRYNQRSGSIERVLSYL